MRTLLDEFRALKKEDWAWILGVALGAFGFALLALTFLYAM